MRKKTIYLLLVFVSVICLYSCTKDKTALPPPVNCTGIVDTINTFSKNIYPNILQGYCSYAPCHGGGSAQYGVDLSTYSGTVSAFENQNVICAIKNAGCVLMPYLQRPLDTSLIRQMECWQANGYPK